MARESAKQDEFLEAAFDFSQWFERHWKTVLRSVGVFVAVAIVVAAVYGWNRAGVKQASGELAAGAAAFERAADSQYGDFSALAEALAHFEAAEAKAGKSSPGPLATYYRGATLFRLGRRDEAIDALETFVARVDGNQPIDWAGRALLASLLSAGGNSQRAIELLEQAVTADSTYPVDQVLVQLGQIQRDAGNTAGARSNWQRVLDDFPQSASAREAASLLGD